MAEQDNHLTVLCIGTMEIDGEEVEGVLLVGSREAIRKVSAAGLLYERVQVLREQEASETIAEGTLMGRSNDNRERWCFGLGPAAMPKPAVVRVRLADRVEYWRIDDPRKRQEPNEPIWVGDR